jgi:hypothetical protein
MEGQQDFTGKNYWSLYISSGKCDDQGYKNFVLVGINQYLAKCGYIDLYRLHVLTLD